MATRTDNLKLSKAEISDAIKSTLTANNQNFDKLDGVITRLKNNQLQGTASGTEIVVTDAGEVESVLHISGNSEQDSRSGKNLFDMVNGVLGDCTKTIDGNSITLTSTLEAGGFSAYTFTTPAKPNTSYYIKSKSTRTGNGGGGIIIQTRNSNNEMISSPVDQRNILNTEKTFTTSADTYYLKIYLYACGTTDIANASATYTEVQLEEGSTATSYEQYGVKPSPDFPSEIRSVKSKSDNLLDISKKKDNTALTWANGIESSSTGAIASDFMPISDIKELNSNYTFSAYYYDTNKAYLGNGPELVKDATAGAYTHTVVPNNSNIVYFRVWFRNGSGGNPSDMTILTDIMLNKGSTALPYQPYGYVPVEVKVEVKNLLNIKEGYVNSATRTYKDDSLTLTSTLETGGYSTFYTFVKAKPNTSYYIQCKSTRTGNGGGGIVIQARRADGTAIREIFQKRDVLNAEGSFITPAETGELRVYFYSCANSGETTYRSATYSEVQLEEGVKTPYEPYVEPKTISLPLGDIELRSTPNGTRDTFERVDGVWNNVNKIWSIGFDGSDDEGWEASTTYMYVLKSTLQYPQKTNGKGLCTHYINDGTTNIGRFTLGNNYAFSFFTEYTTKSEWKAWLNINPITVDYELATPTYTPITDQALITALDELEEELILHKGYNHITATAVNGVKAYLDLEYAKDINIVLGNINASILSLGGGINV